jgi:hypothetical protein
MHLRFEEKHVQEVPQQSGIFCLWDHMHLVYVGRTAPRTTLRTELQHALNIAMADDLCATHFSYEVTSTPKTRAAEELRDHFERWGSLPRYNEARPAHDEGAALRADRAA